MIKSSFKYRDHRGNLAESLKTTQVFDNLKDLIKYLQDSLREYKFYFADSDVKIEPYCYDKRINWDTHIVTIKGFGVAGFTDCDPQKKGSGKI